jgi:hypothetical protein
LGAWEFFQFHPLFCVSADKIFGSGLPQNMQFSCDHCAAIQCGGTKAVGTLGHGLPTVYRAGAPSSKQRFFLFTRFFGCVAKISVAAIGGR